MSSSLFDHAPSIKRFRSSGATSSTYTAAAGVTYRVKATGTGMYYGTVTSDYITAEEIALTGIGDISVAWNDDGTALLTAGAIDPPGATVTYQWQQYYDNGWHSLSGATSSTYTGSGGSRYRVQATGTGMYYGTRSSNGVTLNRLRLVSIGNITVTWDGENPVLTAGAINPTDATFTYQWQSYSSGDWSNITGATSFSYTGTAGIQYRVAAIGFGGYYGTVNSYPVTPNKTPLSGIGNISVTWSGESPVLTAGAVSPPGATFTYQWWSNGGIISGATSSSYTGTAGNSYYVTATGTGAYSGTVTSGTVTPTRTPLDGIGAITVTWNGGTPTLTAGAVIPSGATFTYQWWANSGGGWNSISGATSSSYTGTASTSYYVTATGTGAYSGTATSNTVTPVRTQLKSISVIVTWNDDGTVVLTAGATNPPGATVTYQWQYYSKNNNRWRNISGATASSHTDDADTQYRVVATGIGDYYDTVYSDSVTPTRIQVTGVGNITLSGSTLYAGAVSPTGATVTYQWQRQQRTWTWYVLWYDWSSWSGWSDIGTNAITCPFTPNNSDIQYRYRLIVTGYGQYYDDATSARFPS